MDRREHERRRFWLPLEVEGLARGVAVSHDASDNGMLLVCSSTLPVGSTVVMILRIPPGGPDTVRVAGTIVRVSRNEDDPEGLWPHKMAVKFNARVPELSAFLSSLPGEPSGAEEEGNPGDFRQGR